MTVQQPSAEQATLTRLIELAYVGLVPMFDQREQLFCYRLKKTSTGLVQEGI